MTRRSTEAALAVLALILYFSRATANVDIKDSMIDEEDLAENARRPRFGVSDRTTTVSVYVSGC